MKYKIFQIPFPNTGKEEKIYFKYAFNSLDRIDKVHFEYYTETYSGDINTDSTDVYDILEEIFTELNINHPNDYKGHSLSVSDICEIDNKYYFCDSFGWKEIKI